MEIAIIDDLLKRIELNFKGKYDIEEMFELEKILKNLETEKQSDEVFYSICDNYKYSKLPNIATIVRAVYATGLRKKITLGTRKVCSCGKCLEGSVSVFDLECYKFYEHECEGWKKSGIDGIYALPLKSTWCYNFRSNEKNIHTYLEEMQDYDSSCFEYAYIRLWREYCNIKAFMDFDKYNPYTFYGLGLRANGMKRIILSQITNKFIRSEIEEAESFQHNEVKFNVEKKVCNTIEEYKEEETFEEFLDGSNKEFQKKLDNIK